MVGQNVVHNVNQRRETVINSGSVAFKECRQKALLCQNVCLNVAVWEAVHATVLVHLYCSGQCPQVHSEY